MKGLSATPSIQTTGKWQINLTLLRHCAWHSTVYHRKDKWPLNQFLPPLHSYLLFSPRLEKQTGVLPVFTLLTSFSRIFFLISEMARALQIPQWVSLHPYRSLPCWRYPSYQLPGIWMWQMEAQPTCAARLSWARGSSTPTCLGEYSTGALGFSIRRWDTIVWFPQAAGYLNLLWGPTTFVYNMPLFPSNVFPIPLL